MKRSDIQRATELDQQLTLLEKARQELNNKNRSAVLAIHTSATLINPNDGKDLMSKEVVSGVVLSTKHITDVLAMEIGRIKTELDVLLAS